MLRQEKDLRWQDDDLFLLAFLRARKYDVKRAFGLVKGLYECFGKHGRFYYTMDMNHLKRFMEINSQYVLPYRDSKGSIVYIMRYETWDPDDFALEEVLVCNSLALLQALTCPATQVAGVQFIVDFKGFTSKHFFHTSPSDLIFVANIFQNTVPIRVRGVHIVNQSSAAYYLYNIVKPFVSKKLRERLHFHGSDLNSLHQFFDPSILPANLGGELPSYDNKGWRQKMEASGDYIERMLSFGYKKYLEKDWRRSGNS